NLVFRDAHVPGAETRATAKGELDILYPAFTVFHGLDVNVASGDLRTIQYLYPNFPRLKGTISGTARLDSSWLDVRFSDGDLYWRDGPDTPTHVTGSGRITYGEVFMTYDLDLDAKLLSLTQLGRSYPMMPLRGVVAGPIVAKGTTEALDVNSTLTGAAGTVAFNGRLDTYPPGYAIRGTTTLTHLDARTLLERADVPQSDISARFETDVSGDSLANLAGRIAADVGSGSSIAGVRIFSGRARMEATNGKLHVDSLALESTAATVFASGGIGLAPGTRDSMRVAVFVDSLGGLRRWIAAGSRADSLDGSFSISGTLIGAVDALDARGTVAAASLYHAGTSASAVRGTFALRDLTKQPTGDFILGVDSVHAGGVTLARVDGLLALDGANHGRVSLEGRETTGQTGRAAGEYFLRGDTVEARIDSLSFVADTTAAAARWRLAAPATVISAGGDLSLSTLRLTDGKDGVIALAMTLPARAPIGGSLVVEKASIGDFARLAQVNVPLGGIASLRAAFSGTREAPVIEWTSLLQQPQTAGVRLDRIEGTGRYADRRFNGTARFFRDQAATMIATVSLPIDLAFVPRERRLLGDPLQGNVRADSADLAVLETLAPGLDVTAGRFTVAADLGGTWERPTLDGRISMGGGAARIATLGVRVRGVEASIVMRGDSIALERFVAQSDDPGERGTIAMRGFVDLDYLHHVAGAPSNQKFALDVEARGFHVINQRRLGDLRISSPGLHLAGSTSASTLTGTVIVDKGVVYIPELTKKRVVDLGDSITTDVTGLGRNRPLVPDAPASVVAGLALQNVRLVIGPEVWLRSTEAAIQLGGEVNVTKGRDPRAAALGDLAPEQLALQGTLTADRGQYRLVLGPAISRTFDVTRGRLTFAGDPDLNPALDINAVHTVRTENGQDIRVRVAIRGTLLNPELVLSSDEGLQISQTDLVSYLAFGKPSFEVTGSNGVSYNQLGLGLLSASAGGLVAGAVQNSRFGSAIDVFSVQAGADTSSRLNLQQRIANSRVTLGKQINERTYIGLDAGLCELVGQGSNSRAATGTSNALVNFGDRLGLTINHRLAHGFSVSGGIEPSASAKQCDALQNAAAQITTAPRRQFGLDLSRSWTF
ncbi:MAG TPA: translocation/assembly module TamB domain-containing protein, partial [Gemmatimonadaceae bacterium]|nr:translocation/assembly module TamB domain-containing protein [Gemmatimonadaceae bacterium]